MAHTLTITLDDRTFDKLKQMAGKSGDTPEGVASNAVLTVIENSLLSLAGCLNTGVPDLALRHDGYIAEASMSIPMTVREEPD